MQRLRDKGLTLNRKQCKFRQTQLDYIGYVFFEKGISADPQKVAAIKNATRPENASELPSLLGLANYCSWFIPGFSTMVKPLQELTTSATTWKWNDKAEKVLEELKESLSAACVISYYDQQKETQVLVDASPVGLGVILTQKNKAGGTEVIQYASRALTPVEQRYSQTEREALAIVFGCECFHYIVWENHLSLLLTINHWYQSSTTRNPIHQPGFKDGVSNYNNSTSR